MTDEELREFVRSMIRSVELRTDAMFERHNLSSVAVLDSSAQAPPISPEIRSNIEVPVEPLRITKPSEKALNLVGGDISIEFDPYRSQSTPTRSMSTMVDRRAPKSEKTLLASLGVVDLRSATTNGKNGARGTPKTEKIGVDSSNIVDPRFAAMNGRMILAPMTSVIFVVRDSNWIWHESGRTHCSQRQNSYNGHDRRIWEQRKLAFTGAISDVDGRHDAIREYWSAGINAEEDEASSGGHWGSPLDNYVSESKQSSISLPLSTFSMLN
uniref:Uncharacterized protein n=1 Tax=Cannabis sativa TaxID=3483 RepID=A0A803P569_CANSA